MRHFFTFSFALVLLQAGGAFAQVEFKKGYIVRDKGDTLHGFLCIRKCFGANLGITQVAFKEQPGDATFHFSVNEIRYLSIPGENRYERGIVNRTEVYDEQDGCTCEVIQRTRSWTAPVLMKVLVQGKTVTLYETSSGYYFKLEGQAITQLSDPLSDSRRFRNELTDIARATGQLPHLSQAIENCRYKQRDLENLFLRFNGGNVPYVHNTQLVTRVSMFAGAGVGTGYADLFSGDYEPTIHFTPKGLHVATGGIDIAPAHSTLFFRTGITYSTALYTGRSAISGYPVKQETYNFTQHNLALSFSLNNRFWDDGFVQVYGGVTFQHNFSTHARDFDSIVLGYAGWQESIRFKPSWNCFGASAGAILDKRWEVAIAYQPTVALCPVRNLGFKSRAVFLSMYYHVPAGVLRFGKKLVNNYGPDNPIANL